ncbi:winged helix DNA-binding domain-containing protein [Streptomyces lydicus]|nr:winged helix DNA-binding domain-containing protein [Streptomyces lydicus]
MAHRGRPGWDERRLADVERRTLAALSAHGEATAAELAAEVPDLRDTIVNSPASRTRPRSPSPAGFCGCWPPRAASGAGGRAAAGPAAPTAGGRAPRSPSCPRRRLPRRAPPRRRWLASYGPATVDDLKWWTGWTLTATRQALAAAGAVEVDLDDGTSGVALPGDLAPVAAPEPWAALLPALDPTAMGWKNRDWYLDPAHVPQLFDRSGNIGPTVWWCGRIIGGWARRADGEIVWRLLTDGGAPPARAQPRARGGGEAAAAVAAEAARLAAWLGDVRVTRASGLRWSGS